MDLVAGDSGNERPPPGPPADGPLRIFVVVASSSGKASCFDHQWPEGSPGRLEGAGDTIVGLALAKAWSFCRREEAASDEVLEAMRTRASTRAVGVKGFIEYPVDEYARLAEPVPVTVPLLAEVLLATLQPAGIVFRGSPGMAPATPQASTLADALQRWAEQRGTMGVARLVPRMADKTLEGSCSSLHSVERATEIIHL